MGADGTQSRNEWKENGCGPAERHAHTITGHGSITHGMGA